MQPLAGEGLMPRRINLSGTGLEIVLALSQSSGARASELASILGLPLTTVDAAVRVLANLGVIERDARRRRYTLRPQHAALAELVALAERMPAAGRAIDIVLRASDAVVFAGRDNEGYIVVFEPAPGTQADALEAALQRISSGRDPAIHVIRFDAAEFDRLLRVVPSLRARVAAASQLKSPPGRARARPASA